MMMMLMRGIYSIGVDWIGGGAFWDRKWECERERWGQHEISVGGDRESECCPKRRGSGVAAAGSGRCGEGRCGCGSGWGDGGDGRDGGGRSHIEAFGDMDVMVKGRNNTEGECVPYMI